MPDFHFSHSMETSCSLALRGRKLGSSESVSCPRLRAKTGVWPKLYFNSGLFYAKCKSDKGCGLNLCLGNQPHVFGNISSDHSSRNIPLLSWVTRLLPPRSVHTNYPTSSEAQAKSCLQGGQKDPRSTCETKTNKLLWVLTFYPASHLRRLLQSFCLAVWEDLPCHFSFTMETTGNHCHAHMEETCSTPVVSHAVPLNGNLWSRFWHSFCLQLLLETSQIIHTTQLNIHNSH